MADKTIVIADPADDTVDGVQLAVSRSDGKTVVTISYIRNAHVFSKSYVGAEIPTGARTPLRNALLALLADARVSWGF